MASESGLTRDRRYGLMTIDSGSTLTLIDTGGLYGEHELSDLLMAQTDHAIAEADVVLFLLMLNKVSFRWIWKFSKS